MAAPGSTFGPFHFDPVEWRLSRDGQPVVAQDKALHFIAALLERPGGMWTRDELYARLWPGVFVSDDALFQAARKARAALGDDSRKPRWIETVPGRGYRFIGALNTAPAPAVPVATPSPPTPPEPGALGVRCLTPAVQVIGREVELSDIRSRFSEGARLVTLLGPAGAGKTTLALVEGASRGDPAHFVDLLDATDADSILHAMGEGLGADGGGPDGPRAVLRAIPSGPGALVVLDNAELCTRPLAALVLSWLAGAPGTQFLVTSRRPLELAAEQVVSVGSLTGPAAARLFRARAAARGVQLNEPDRGLVDDVVLALDGLPLALELAASRVGLLGLGGLLDRLREPLELLHSNRLDLPERHRSMRAALELSWYALDPVERAFLAGCCVFRGPFRVEDAELVLALRGASTLDLIGAVVDASLVRPVGPSTDGGPPRLAPYAAVRELAFELGDPSQIEAVRHRHLDWMARQSDGLGLGREPGPAAHPRLAPLLEDGAQAMRFAVEHRRLAEAARVAAWLVPVMARRGAGLRALALLDGLGPPEALGAEQALTIKLLRAVVAARGLRPEQAPALFQAVADQAVAQDHPAAELAALLHWADVMIGRNVSMAADVLIRAHQVQPRASDPAINAMFASLDAVVRYHRGDTEGGRAALSTALDTLRDLDEGWWVAQTLIQHAEFAHLEHHYDEAERWVRQALAVYEAAAAPATIDFALSFLGVIRQAQGRLDEALSLLLPLRDRAHRNGDVQREQHLVYTLGGVYGMLGRLQEATAAFESSLALTRQQKNPVHEGWVLMRLAGSSWRLERMEAARDWLLQAIAVFSAAGRPILAEAARTELGYVALLVGDLAEAEAVLAVAVARLGELDSRARAALASARLAEATAGKDGEQARAQARAAVELLRQDWPLEGQARALVSLGLIELALGDRDAARRAYDEAEGIRAEAGDIDGDIARDVRRLGGGVRNTYTLFPNDNR